MRLLLGLTAVGVAYGAAYGVASVAITLVRKAANVTNLAQMEMGAAAVVIAHRLRTAWGLPISLSILGGVVMGVIIGAGVDLVIMRRLEKRPPLVRLIATLGVAEILRGTAVVLLRGWRPVATDPPDFALPFSLRIHIDPLLISEPHIVSVICGSVIVAAISILLTRTTWGLEARATFSSRQRAGSLGVKTARISLSMWGLAGALSTISGLLWVFLSSSQEAAIAASSGIGLLVRALAGAALGGFGSHTSAFLGGIAVGVLEQFILWWFPSAGESEAVFTALLLALLLLMRPSTASARSAQRESFFVPRRPDLPLPVLLVVVGAALILPLVARESVVQTVMLVLIYSVLGMSIITLTGWRGFVSLGQLGVAGIGALAAFFAVEVGGLTVVPAIAAACFAGGIVMVLAGLPEIRLRSNLLPLTTLSLASAVSGSLLQIRTLPWIETSLAPPRLWASVALNETSLYYLCVALVITMSVALMRVRRHRFGLSVIASHDNDLMARAVGIDVNKVSRRVMMLSGAIAGLGGALLLLHEGRLFGGSYGAVASLQAVAMALIGGVSSPLGAVTGASYLKGARTLFPQEWAVLFGGVGLLLILIYSPQGLIETIRRVFGRGSLPVQPKQRP